MVAPVPRGLFRPLLAKWHVTVDDVPLVEVLKCTHHACNLVRAQHQDFCRAKVDSGALDALMESRTLFVLDGWPIMAGKNSNLMASAALQINEFLSRFFSVTVPKA